MGSGCVPEKNACGEPAVMERQYIIAAKTGTKAERMVEKNTDCLLIGRVWDIKQASGMLPGFLTRVVLFHPCITYNLFEALTVKIWNHERAGQ